jgi:hypothetical protein
LPAGAARAYIRRVEKSDRQALLVLGMHRSGTSALAGALGKLGAALPAHLMPAAAENPRGFAEALPVANLNDAILRAAGSRWDDWRAFDPKALSAEEQARFGARLDAVLWREFADAPLLVLKDPRICRMLVLWLPAMARLAVAPLAVLCLRHPFEVQRSLATRNRFPPEKSLLLWLRHVLDAEAATRDMPRCFVVYDDLLADWRGTLGRAATALGLEWPAGDAAQAVDFHLTAALRHHRAPPDAPVADSACATAWTEQSLETWHALAAGGGEPDRLTMNRIRAQFDDACRLFGPTTGWEWAQAEQARRKARLRRRARAVVAAAHLRPAP